MDDRPVERVLDLTDPARNRIGAMSLEQARERVARGDPDAVREIDGSFALWGRDGVTVRLARSIDRPLRYFLAKQTDGPLLILADRIDMIRDGLSRLGLAGQFHPSYTRMVPAHHIVSIRLDNGIVSAGVAATSRLARELEFSEGGAAWQRLLDRLPSVRESSSAAHRPSRRFSTSPVSLSAHRARADPAGRSSLRPRPSSIPSSRRASR